jgi:large subunit ribosomal protein L18
MKLNRLQQRQRRHWRVRKKVRGNAARPRLCVCFSSKHIYAQIIDDDKGVTLAAVSTLDAEAGGKAKNNVATARLLGGIIAKRALAKNITQVVFDRGGFRYHGKVKELADGARQGGLKF